MRSEAKTVEEYISSLPEERKDAITKVRETILKNLPKGYQETMNWGMIAYEIPLETYPDTYNGQPLMYAALASQKNHMAVYLNGIYTSENMRKKFEAEYNATGKRLDAGKSCVRFKKLDDLPLDLIGKTITSMSVSDLINLFETVYPARKKAKHHQTG
jgi:uncharacterized protein YdhG (YjbR/CyaY superfamily)